MKDRHRPILSALILLSLLLFQHQPFFCTLQESTEYDKGQNKEETLKKVQNSVSTDETAKQLAMTEQHMYHMKCLKHVLFNELPIARGQDRGTTKAVVFAHHGDAGHWQVWNRALAARMKGLKTLDRLTSGGKACNVWEVGANIAANDSRELIALYGTCKYHAFEPVPEFNEKLEEAWKDENRMTVHKFGIGDKNQTFSVSKNSLAGKDGVATFLGDGADITASAKLVNITIKSFDYALEKADGIPSLVQMNCEGCEWDFLKDALEHGWLREVPIIQIGWHQYGNIGVGARAWELCEIRKTLSETHVMDYGLAFGWERWSLRELKKQNKVAFNP